MIDKPSTVWSKLSSLQENIEKKDITADYDDTIPDQLAVNVTIGQLHFSIPFFLVENLSHKLQMAMTDYELDKDLESKK